MNIRCLLLCACLPMAATASPDALPTAPPADARLALTLTAHGVQIYECREQAWAHVAPEAVLRDLQGRVAGTHGAGPTWQLADGSRVGARVLARMEAPGGRELPWQLMAAQDAPASGALAGVRYIQRLNTWGGQAPAGACMPRQSARVAYTADYIFYRGTPEAWGQRPGAAVHAAGLQD